MPLLPPAASTVNKYSVRPSSLSPTAVRAVTVSYQELVFV